MKFRYEDLDTTEVVLELIDRLYALADKFPSDEKFGLTSQISRAANSILLNLAEGSARKSPADFSRFITIALGSTVETHACLKIAVRRKYISSTDLASVEPLIHQVWRMLCRLRDSQRSR